jgi:enamine deaminase RidA (YjgF/YER057c/UK114 family)
MLTTRGRYPAVVLPGGKLVFLDGGLYEGARTVVLKDGRTFLADSSSAELYDPASGTFTRAGDYAHAPPVGWETVTLLRDGRVLLTGDQMPYPGPSSAAVTELFDPASGTFSRTGPMDNWSETAGWGTLLTDGTVLFVQWCFDVCSDYVDIYDPATGTFSGIGSLGSDLPYSQAVRLQDGTVLVTGGQVPGGDGTSETQLYLPASNAFVRAVPMTTGRHNHTATLLPDGTVLIAGGYSTWRSATPRTASAEIYTPPAAH